MHWPGELIEGAAEILDDTLQPKADAEHRPGLPGEQRQGLRHGEIRRPARAWRQHDEVGRHARAQRGAGQGRAQRFDRGAGLAQIAGEGVDEGILVIDQQYASPLLRPRRRLLLRLGLASDRREHRRGLRRHSASSAAGSLSCSSVAPARTSATPLFIRTVRNVRPVFISPSKPVRPIAPPYHRRAERSFCSMNRIAQGFGAPVTVTAQAWLRNPSSASNSGRSRPSTWSTVWISRNRARSAGGRSRGRWPARRRAICRCGRHRCTWSARPRPWPN